MVTRFKANHYHNKGPNEQLVTIFIRSTLIFNKLNNYFLIEMLLWIDFDINLAFYLNVFQLD